MNAKLSVVIVVYRSEKHIGPCLGVLQEVNDIGKHLEVIVVDNEAGGAETRQKSLEASFPSLNLKYVRNSRNGGYGQGNNLGIRHASAPCILIMNPDVRLVGTTPARICKAFEQDNRLALLGMRQLLGNGSRGRSFMWARGLPPGFLGSALVWAGNRFGWFFPRWECIQGSCFALRKHVFESVGMFDESVFMYGEERDIHHRLYAAKAVIACDWTMTYRHLTDQRDLNLESQKRQWKVRSDWCERHGIPRRRLWNALRCQIRTALWVARLKAMGKTTAKIRFLEEKLAALESCAGNGE